MTNPKIYINRAMRRLFPNRRYKDALFRRVFQDKKDLLDLYNALNQTSYDDPNLIEITTLEDVIYMSVKDDLSFIIASYLNLYEHQSTVNPNMPLRGLLYFARQYQTYVQKQKFDIYGHKLISLPFPQFVIFYNGAENQTDDFYLKLSDAFPKSDTGAIPALECTARVLNINYGHNEALQSTCKRLHDYSFFVAKVKEFIDADSSLEVAITAAIDYCIDEGILTDILTKCRAEVFDMLLTEYDAKFHEKCIRKEEFEDGFAKGISQGISQGRNDERTSTVKRLILKNYPDNEIMEIANCSKEMIEQMRNELS